ncbi:hypothetical protein OG896_24575 [Streptomyces sp. NBC_00669]|uniref:hypothetical protein n=1 Tax=Streptomyces sp. NBC_00669 TaxID=2976011 RepID=UPI002E32E298|nr:hypothetical protein [Streptomyces sp. NBC_00669]
MACSCAKNKTTYKVTNTDGKVVYSSTNKPTADSVARRYPGSTVTEHKPGAKTTPAPTA